MQASRKKRVDRVAKTFAALPISRSVVKQALDDFRKTGELPQNQAVAKAVIEWAERGLDPSQYGDSLPDQLAMLRAYRAQPDSERDELMNLIRLEAVLAHEPIRSIARRILKQFAADGHDPSQPLFQQGRIPKPVFAWGSVALSLLKFPFGLVDKADHPRLELVMERFRPVQEMLAQKDDAARDAWFDQLEEAAEAFDAGETVADAMMHEALMAEQELRALLFAKDREQQGA